METSILVDNTVDKTFHMLNKCMYIKMDWNIYNESGFLKYMVNVLKV